MNREDIEQAGEGNALLLEEQAACLEQASAQLEGILQMLGGCPADHPMTARSLLALLRPVADQLGQALQIAELGLSPGAG